MSRGEQIAEELKSLHDDDGLKPERVVEWAQKHKNSVLHSCFEWNNTKAAHAYRLWQARELIVSVQITRSDGVTHQLYVSPVETRGAAGGYQPLAKVLDDKAMRALFLAQALDELERVCTKYESLCELAGVRAAVKLVRQKQAGKKAA